MSAVIAAIAVVAIAAGSPVVFAQGKRAPAAGKLVERTPMQIELDKVEGLFGSAKYREALKGYEAFRKKHEKFSFTEEYKALFQLRIASCAYYLKDWATAERELLEFLKSPNGTGDLIDLQNNYIGIAQVTLSDVYARQEKWNEAVDLLSKLVRKPDSLSEDRTRAMVALTRVLEAKNAGGNAATIKKIAQDSIAYLKPLISTRNYAVPEIKETANRIVELLIKIGEEKEARALQDDISAQVSGSALDIAMANFQRIDMGDSLFRRADAGGDAQTRLQLYRQALSSYQETLRHRALSQIIDEAVRLKEEEVTRFKNANPKLTEPPKEGEPAKEADPLKEKLAKLIESKEVFLKAAQAFKENKDYDAFISYRIALCLLELKRPWEAYIAFRDVFDNNTGFSNENIARYYYITALEGMHRYTEAQEACRDFILKFPKEDPRLLGDVALTSGRISMNASKFDDAVKQFRWAREKLTTLTVAVKEELDWSLCFSLFSNLDWEEARAAIEKFIASYPESKQQEQMHYLRALCWFFQGKFRETIAAFNAYRVKYPKGEFLPDADYRLAIVNFGVKIPDGEKSMKCPFCDEVLTERTLANHRRTETLKRCEKWLKDYAKPGADAAAAINRQRPEIYTLVGDVYIQYLDDRKNPIPDTKKKETFQNAISAYILAAKGARDNETVLRFTTAELNKRLVAHGEWAKLFDLYIALYEWDRDSSRALDYLYWILRASEKLGKTADERRANIARSGLKVPAEFEEFITKTPEEVLSSAIIRNIDDPRKESVDSLITNLAERIVLKYRRRPKTQDATTPPPPDPEAQILALLKLKDNATLPQPQVKTVSSGDRAAAGMEQAMEQAMAEMLQSLPAGVSVVEPKGSQTQAMTEMFQSLTVTSGDAKLTVVRQPNNGGSSLLAQARGYYARAEVARAMRNPQRRGENLDKIATIYKPEELSPALLGTTAEHLLAKKDNAKAILFADYILEYYRSSDYVDFGFYVKGEILLQKAKFEEALRLTQEALSAESVLMSKEKEIRLANARALVETGKLDLAAKSLLSIAGNRQWRGETTASALYYLGRIEEKRGKENEAINYYWRCANSWRKYGDVTVQAYQRLLVLYRKKGDQGGVDGVLKELRDPNNPASQTPAASTIK
ncbi:MAG: outer membrane protein assembly factor BamD [Puniceicoccales bacterium]|nr:outer membrane protein assembly factor BamD [Puniceicoccales bacterium]